jgi:hypothetical protein
LRRRSNHTRRRPGPVCEGRRYRRSGRRRRSPVRPPWTKQAGSPAEPAAGRRDRVWNRSHRGVRRRRSLGFPRPVTVACRSRRPAVSPTCGVAAWTSALQRSGRSPWPRQRARRRHPRTRQ